MQFTINILSLERETKPTQKGSYQQLTVNFKNIEKGKVESKKLMSFTKPDTAYKALSDAKAGDTFTITAQKNEQSGYWDWTNATQQAPGAATPAQFTPGQANIPKPAWQGETSEERAKKQVSIVRQSSVKEAVQLAIGGNTSVYGGKKPSLEEILAVAQQITEFVFSDKPAKSLFEEPNDLPQTEDFPD